MELICWRKISLLDYAKVLANDKKLKIVLVSSGGSVMPLLEDTSGTNRSIKTIEVLDISYILCEYFCRVDSPFALLLVSLSCIVK